MNGNCECFDACGYETENDYHLARIVNARKQHVCGECGEAIERGESFEIVVGGYHGLGGQSFSAKTCMVCREIRVRFFCSWCYGRVWDDLADGFETFQVCCLERLSVAARDKVIAVIDDHWGLE